MHSQFEQYECQQDLLSQLTSTVAEYFFAQGVVVERDGMLDRRLLEDHCRSIKRYKKVTVDIRKSCSRKYTVDMI